MVISKAVFLGGWKDGEEADDEEEEEGGGDMTDTTNTRVKSER